MLETSARLLRLLSLLQAHKEWTGPELAARLGVSTRTVRNDVERLRSLGYPVHATPGVAGGYRLGAGAALPPLLLDDEEAVAVAVGLGRAAGGGVAGIEESSVRALAKLEQVLPARLRHRVNALNTYTVQIPGEAPAVAPEVLTTIANAARDRERLRFDYVGHDGTESVREAEPYRLGHRRGGGGLRGGGGAVPAGPPAGAVVPGRLGRAPQGLADLPRRPHQAARSERPAVHPA